MASNDVELRHRTKLPEITEKLLKSAKKITRLFAKTKKSIKYITIAF